MVIKSLCVVQALWHVYACLTVHVRVCARPYLVQHEGFLLLLEQGLQLLGTEHRLLGGGLLELLRSLGGRGHHGH